MTTLPATRLTEKQADFIEHVLSGLEPIVAAKRAGYGNEHDAAKRLLRAPAILYAVEIGLRQKLHGELVPLAFKTLQELVQSADSDRVKLDAAKTILHSGGFGPAKQTVRADEREPEAMSTGELHALIARLERELGDRSMPVSGTVDAQVIDNVEEVAPI